MSSAELHLSSRAYAKMILHAAKYPHLAVNGVLLAKASATTATKSSGRLDVVDTIPLFHQCLYVTPMVEVALAQIEVFADAEGLRIVGYYAAGENFADNQVERAPGLRIAEKIVDFVPNAAVVMIENKRFGLSMSQPAVNAWHPAGGGGGSDRTKWTRTEAVHIEQSNQTMEAVSELVQRSAARDLQDFDNYLDNVQNDWRNAQLNLDLPKLLAMY